MDFDELGAIATLVGCIIGAGIFAIPYTVAESGFLTGILVIVFLGLCSLLLNLFAGEIFLRTEGDHALTTLASKYIGKKSKYLMRAAMMVGIYGGLTAYILGVGSAASSILRLNPVFCSLVFILLMASIIYFKVNFLERVEVLFVLFILLLVVAITWMSFGSVDYTQLNIFDHSKIFIPFGVILFSYSGVLAIGEMKQELGKKAEKFRKSIVVGSLIPLILYSLFSFLVVGITGNETTQVATIGLGKVIGNNILFIGNLFVIFAMTTSFLTTAYALKDMFMDDLNLNNFKAWTLVILVPLVIAFSGMTDFISALGVSGSFSTGLIFILIILMHKKAKSLGKLKPAFSIPYNPVVSGFLIFIFLAGILYYILQFFI